MLGLSLQNKMRICFQISVLRRLRFSVFREKQDFIFFFLAKKDEIQCSLPQKGNLSSLLKFTVVV